MAGNIFTSCHWLCSCGRIPLFIREVTRHERRERDAVITVYIVYIQTTRPGGCPTPVKVKGQRLKVKPQSYRTKSESRRPRG